MKKHKVILLAISAVLFSCGTPGEDLTRTTEYRIIKNTSSHVVDLTINANNKYHYQLDLGDSVIFEGYCESGPGYDYCEMGWNGTESISGSIVFDNEREIVYENGSCENGRNPLNPSILELHDCGYFNPIGHVEYIYEINDADYEMAVPIEK